LNVKLKWAQNKLKSESEAHKEVQSKLTTTLQKLQESREEGEQIRDDMKAMIVAYQVCGISPVYVNRNSRHTGTSYCIENFGKWQFAINLPQSLTHQLTCSIRN